MKWINEFLFLAKRLSLFALAMIRSCRSVCGVKYGAGASTLGGPEKDLHGSK